MHNYSEEKESIEQVRASHTLLPEREAAKYLGVSIRSLQKWRWMGGGPRFIRLTPRAVRYRMVDLDIWVNSRIRSSTSDTNGGTLK